MTPSPTTQNVPLGSVTGVESLVTFGLQVFLSIFGALRHPATPLPVSAVPAVATALKATPGVTQNHQAVIDNMTAAAVAVHSS